MLCAWGFRTVTSRPAQQTASYNTVPLFNTGRHDEGLAHQKSEADLQPVSYAAAYVVEAVDSAGCCCQQ